MTHEQLQQIRDVLTLLTPKIIPAGTPIPKAIAILDAALAVPEQKPVGCKHFRYSVGVHEQTGTCYDQTALELCEVCGWKTLIPGDCCLNCERGKVEQEPVAHYGIIDPDYARVFTMARCLAWQEGYALAMHGSFTRDLDLIAIPWTDSACDPEHLVRRIVQAADLEMHIEPSEKPHGRLAFTLMFKGFGDPRFIDLSVAQRQQTPVAAPQREWQGLTPDEINDCAGAEIYPSTWAMDFAIGIEQTLRRKNHG